MEEKDPNTFIAEIGKRILHRRKELGYTQEYLAEKANLSHQFFSAIETGKKNMKAESVIKLSQSLGVSTDYILFGTHNSVDFSNVYSKIETLNPHQTKCLYDIIDSFISACQK